MLARTRLRGRRYFGRRRRLLPRLAVAAAAGASLAVGLVLWRTSGEPGALGQTSGSPAVRSVQPPATTTTVPTPAAPYRVLVVGDSLGEDLGAQIVSQWSGGGAVAVDMAAQGDTGLVNQSYYNWPAQLQGQLAATHAQLVVAMFAANDDQGMMVNGTAVAFGTSAWSFAYAERVSEMVQEATAAGAHVLWVGEPAMQNTSLNAAVQLIDTLDDRVVSSLPGALYLDPNPVLSPGGQFLATSPTSPATTTRTPDGVHLTAGGAGLLATAAAQAVAAGWHVELP